jgi:hypothetical protein
MQGGKPAQSALGVAVSACHERVGDGLPNKAGYSHKWHLSHDKQLAELCLILTCTLLVLPRTGVW